MATSLESQGADRSPHGKLPLGSGVTAPGPANGWLPPALGPGVQADGAALPDTWDCPRGRGVFDKLPLGSRDAKQAQGSDDRILRVDEES